MPVLHRIIATFHDCLRRWRSERRDFWIPSAVLLLIVLLGPTAAMGALRRLFPALHGRFEQWPHVIPVLVFGLLPAAVLATFLVLPDFRELWRARRTPAAKH